MLMPRDTAWRFKREFEEEYGSISLPFFEGGVAQAQDLAKKDLKFLLIVLMSPEHDDNETFVKETLLAPEVVNYISDPANKIILWGGNILDSEAYQVSQEYNCTKFPFSALVCLTPKEGSTRMGIIKRMVGPTPAGEYLSELRAAMDKYTSDLDEARAERAAREAARSLRTEQDSAYERSLARDRERARQKREAAAAAAEAERKSKADAERAAHMEDLRQQWRRWRASTVAAEPDGSAKEVVRIALKMPEATGAGRIVRKFRSQSTMEDLYAFIECYDLVQSRQAAGFDDTLTKPTGYDHEYRFRLVSVMPRVVYEPSESTTIGEKIGRSGNLIVEDHTLESDGEDDD
jgi:FAS-associated factor 2